MKRKTKEKFELVRGSGNVFRDLNRPDADIKQLKGILAAEIIKLLDRESLTVRAAHAKTGIAAADFSRIRNADLARFTVDRLIGVVNRLGAGVLASTLPSKSDAIPQSVPLGRSDAATT